MPNIEKDCNFASELEIIEASKILNINIAKYLFAKKKQSKDYYYYYNYYNTINK